MLVEMPGFTPPAFPPLGPRIKVLMVSPRVPFSYWSVHHIGGPVKSLVPPLGLLTIAALCPKDWTIRLRDLNFEELSDEDVRQADLIMLSGMQDQDTT